MGAGFIRFQVSRNNRRRGSLRISSKCWAQNMRTLVSSAQRSQGGGSIFFFFFVEIPIRRGFFVTMYKKHCCVPSPCTSTINLFAAVSLAHQNEFKVVYRSITFATLFRSKRVYIQYNVQTTTEYRCVPCVFVLFFFLCDINVLHLYRI